VQLLAAGHQVRTTVRSLKGEVRAIAFAWTDGELLIWITSNRPFHALSDLGKAFEKEVRAAVKVETHDQIIDRFQSAAQSGKGPDIFFWANDRIGEWADSGLLKPLRYQKRIQGEIPADVLGMP
jgi:maltose-binding protein MalE